MRSAADHWERQPILADRGKLSAILDELPCSSLLFGLTTMPRWQRLSELIWFFFTAPGVAAGR